MNVATKSARQTVEIVTSSGRDRDRNVTSLLFLGALWFSLFFGIMVLLVLIIDTAMTGAGRFDADLLTRYGSIVDPSRYGFRAGILGTVWLMGFTALFAVPLGIAAAVYLEEFSNDAKWYNRLLEVNLQNLAAVPSIIYGLLAVAVMALLGFKESGIVLGGAIALALLILPIIIITTREALRGVPGEIRQGSLALGATVWQTVWHQTLPAAIPGISTGTILGISRAIGEAAPLVVVGLAGSVLFDPAGVQSPITALPIQIFSITSRSQVEYQTAASAAIIVLLILVLGLNALAIVIRNKFQRTW